MPLQHSDQQEIWTREDLRLDPHQRTDKASRVRSMFNAIAGCYDRNNRVHSLGRDQAWRKRTVRLCSLHPSDAVLDVACGTGDLTEALCAAGPASVTGLDFSPGMLQVAKEKWSRRTPPAAGDPASLPAPVYVHGDATALPFDDASFDILSIAFGLRNVDDPGAALGEFRRVLKPGGRLAVLEFTEPRNRVLRFLNRIYTRRIMPVTASLIAGDRTGAYRYLPCSIATFLDRDALGDLVLGHGFEDLEQHPMSGGICTCFLARRPAGE